MQLHFSGQAPTHVTTRMRIQQISFTLLYIPLPLDRAVIEDGRFSEEIVVTKIYKISKENGLNLESDVRQSFPYIKPADSNN